MFLEPRSAPRRTISRSEARSRSKASFWAETRLCYKRFTHHISCRFRIEMTWHLDDMLTIHVHNRMDERNFAGNKLIMAPILRWAYNWLHRPHWLHHISSTITRSHSYLLHNYIVASCSHLLLLVHVKTEETDGRETMVPN